MITAAHRHPHPASPGAQQAKAALHQVGQFLHAATHGHTGSLLFLIALVYLGYLGFTRLTRRLRG